MVIIMNYSLLVNFFIIIFYIWSYQHILHNQNYNYHHVLQILLLLQTVLTSTRQHRRKINRQEILLYQVVLERNKEVAIQWQDELQYHRVQLWQVALFLQVLPLEIQIWWAQHRHPLVHRHKHNMIVL